MPDSHTPSEKFDALAIEYRPLDRLVPYARNARTHSEGQVALIVGSIREFGFTNPVLVDAANGIIAGHGRVMAARKLGLPSVPVIELGHLRESQKRACIPDDKKLAQREGWREQGMLSVALDDEQLTWPARKLLRQLGEWLYGPRPARKGPRDD